MYRLFSAALLVLLLAPLSAQEATEADPVGDTTAINWFYPGEFKDALKAAEEQDRLMLIKCVFFGVDKEGAGCATKGLW